MKKSAQLKLAFTSLVLLMFVNLFLQSCKKDNHEIEKIDPIQMKKIEEYLKGPQITTVNLSEVQSKLSNLNLGALNSAFRAKGENAKVMAINTPQTYAGYAINTDSVKVITANGHTMYVFQVQLTSEHARSFQNLTIDESKDGIIAFVTAYTPTATWLNDYRAGRAGKFDGQISTAGIKLDGADLLHSTDGLQSSPLSKNKQELSVIHGPNELAVKEVCNTTTYYYSVPYLCASGEHGPADPNCNLSGSQAGGYVNLSSIITVCTESGGGGGVGENPGGGGGGTTPNVPSGYNPCPTPPPLVSRIGGKGQQFAVREDATPCDPVIIIPQPPLSPDEAFLNKIDISTLSPCFASKLAAITSIGGTAGSIPDMIKTFSGTSVNYNWIMKNGTITTTAGAETGPYNRATKQITTTFDSNKYKNASDLDIYKTILHESVHAYLATYFASDALNATKSYPEMVEEASKSVLNVNQIHHEEFVRAFAGKIASALRAYGDKQGYTFTTPSEKDEFYHNMSWGGLQETSAFGGLAPSIKERILNTLSIEHNGIDKDGNVKAFKGVKGGC